MQKKTNEPASSSLPLTNVTFRTISFCQNGSEHIGHAVIERLAIESTHLLHDSVSKGNDTNVRRSMTLRNEGTLESRVSRSVETPTSTKCILRYLQKECVQPSEKGLSRVLPHAWHDNVSIKPVSSPRREEGVLEEVSITKHVSHKVDLINDNAG